MIDGEIGNDSNPLINGTFYASCYQGFKVNFGFRLGPPGVATPKKL